MATSYKTPGVYVEEISTFPPSVAQVETAIPAFVGYTETALKDGNDLTNIPTRIVSLLEYETYFGKAEAETSMVINIELAPLIKKYKNEKFLLPSVRRASM